MCNTLKFTLFLLLMFLTNIPSSHGRTLEEQFLDATVQGNIFLITEFIEQDVDVNKTLCVK